MSRPASPVSTTFAAIPTRPRHPRPARKDGLRQRHESLLRELRLAEQVQKSMLPRALPEVPGVGFGAGLRPCRYLAGDFYNAFRLDRDRVGFYLGDVMGHGPAAALLGVFAMQVIRTKLIAANSYEIVPPAEVLATLNRDLIAAEFPDGPFVTLIYGVLDLSRRTWTYCSGGHPPALRLRAGARPEPLGEGGPLLGIIEAPFTQREVELAPGDRLVLHSDGVDTVRWGDFGPGPDGLAACLSARAGDAPQAQVDAAFGLAGPGEFAADDVAVLMAQIAA